MTGYRCDDHQIVDRYATDRECPVCSRPKPVAQAIRSGQTGDDRHRSGGSRALRRTAEARRCKALSHKSGCGPPRTERSRDRTTVKGSRRRHPAWQTAGRPNGTGCRRERRATARCSPRRQPREGGRQVIASGRCHATARVGSVAIPAPFFVPPPPPPAARLPTYRTLLHRIGLQQALRRAGRPPLPPPPAPRCAACRKRGIHRPAGSPRRDRIWRA